MKKILIVDDDPMVRQLVKMSLPTYICIEAPDGETALQLIQAERPDVIFLDWVLPGMSGLNVFKTLKRYPDQRDIPVVIVSARGEEAVSKAAQELGAAGHLAKPFDVNDLRAVIARAVK